MSLELEARGVGDYRYTDRDVREQPALMQVAFAFLKSYGGDFDFLVQAQLRLHTEGVLTTGVIRGVLNCMRIDPTAVDQLPRIPPQSFKARLSLVPARSERPTRVLVWARFNMPYIISTHPAACVMHVLDRERSRLYWLPLRQDWDFRPQILCSRTVYMPKLLMVRFLPEGRRWCKICKQRWSTSEA